MDHDTEMSETSAPSSAEFRAFTDVAPVGIAYATAGGEITYANERWRELSGYRGGLPTDGTTMLQVIHPDDRPTVIEAFRRSREDRSEIRERVRVCLPDGSICHVALALRTIFDDDGDTTGYAVGLTDVTELAQAVEEVRVSETRFRAVTAALPIGVFRTDRDGNLFWANTRMEEISGFDRIEASGASVFGFTHTEDQEAVYLRAQEALIRREPFESTHRFVSRDGSVRWVISRASAIYDDAGSIVEHVGTIEDVTELHRISEGFAHRAHHDPLTDLPNRASIEQVISDLCDQIPGRSDIGLVFVDLDGFKAVNDTYGHKAGDEVLVAIARRLSGAIRSEDVVGRYGGDEFVVVCPGVTDPTVVDRVAERISHTIGSEPILVGDDTCRVGASVGTAIGPGSESPDAFLHAADVAMYEAKRSR